MAPRVRHLLPFAILATALLAPAPLTVQLLLTAAAGILSSLDVRVGGARPSRPAGDARAGIRLQDQQELATEP